VQIVAVCQPSQRIVSVLFDDVPKFDFFFFQAEDGIRVRTVTGVQTCALPIFVGFTLLVANFGSGMGAQIGAARLLYGMGRSKALPESFFGVVDPKRHVPRNNVIFVGAIALAGAFVISYGLGAEMLNFGALIAFMGV